MNIIEEIYTARRRWIRATGHIPDYVVLGQFQYRQCELSLSPVAMDIMESTVQRGERLSGMDIILAGNKESCILFGQYAHNHYHW